MKCEESAEFISALYDGERIPHDAAEHIGGCSGCRTRLSEYAEIGAELRRVASLDETQEVKAGSWRKEQNLRSKWWQKGWGTMRIPKIAFASMLVLIVALGSGFAMLKARTLAPGKALVLTINYPEKSSMRCGLSISNAKVSKGDSVPSCGFFTNANSGVVGVFFRILGTDGERFELGVRAKVAATAGSVSKEVEDLPDVPYWFEPGEKLEIPVDGLGPVTLTGKVLDYMPSIVGEENLDPAEGEFRMISPVLLRDKELVFDLAGTSATTDHADQYGFDIYAPAVGRCRLSLSPIEGAIEGEINQNRIHFVVHGESYLLLTAAPIARKDRIWILHQPDYRPSHEPGASPDSDNHPRINTANLSRILGKVPERTIN
jgi:hypothetical protein